MPYHRLNFQLEILEVEHKQMMSNLQKLPMEISDALDKCKGVIEETEYFRGVVIVGRDGKWRLSGAHHFLVVVLHGHVLRQRTQLIKNVHALRLKNRLLRKEQIKLQESREEVKRLLKEAHEKTCDSCAEKQQVRKSPIKLEQATAQDESLLQAELLQQEQCHRKIKASSEEDTTFSCD
ncbi:hypothetical protein A6R68_07466 [Neotoma lepida]|uniref:Disks large homolog 5 N-terminal domain-containing protein n=1 Tax=Neotoma lepida TaxID=56216 RepID=A0A1A6GE14_NEOLE|nr:hypothetical protein A6R68_07466 [Neotoma lepida]